MSILYLYPRYGGTGSGSLSGGHYGPEGFLGGHPLGWPNERNAHVGSGVLPSEQAPDAVGTEPDLGGRGLYRRSRSPGGADPPPGHSSPRPADEANHL